MPDLKLGKLPERSPIKLSISIMPDLAADLSAYAELYKEAYGREETLADLIPAMLTTFLASDRAFVRTRRARM
jgi:hypothetical protein